MNATIREELLAELTRFGERYPEWRFGQLVSNVAGWACEARWETVDDVMLLTLAHDHLQRRFGTPASGTAVGAVAAETRQKLLKALREVGARFPQLGCVQLVANLAARANANVYDVEDLQLLEAVEGVGSYVA